MMARQQSGQCFIGKYGQAVLNEKPRQAKMRAFTPPCVAPLG